MVKRLFICYSVPLMKYLISQGLEYEVVGLNPDSKKTFWVFFICDKLNHNLDNWKNKSNLINI